MTTSAKRETCARCHTSQPVTEMEKRRDGSMMCSIEAFCAERAYLAEAGRADYEASLKHDDKRRATTLGTSQGLTEWARRRKIGE